MACQALMFRLGKLEEQLDSAECYASAATAAQADLAERELTLVQELQVALSVRDTLQAQVGSMALDLHTTSQQRDLAFEQLSQFVAGSGAASFDVGASAAQPSDQCPFPGVADSGPGTLHADVQDSPPSNDEQGHKRALQELQSISEKAQREAERLQRELESAEAGIATLRADVARADSATAEATLERNRATENAVRAERDLAAAQLRVAALQQQEEGSSSLKQRFADSEHRVRVCPLRLWHAQPPPPTVPRFCCGTGGSSQIQLKHVSMRQQALTHVLDGKYAASDRHCVHMQDLDLQLNAMQREVAGAQADRDRALAQNSELNGRMKALSSREEESRTARETISADLASLRVQLAESAAEASRMWDECTDLRRRLSNAEDTMHAEREKALEANRAAARLQGELREARRDTDAARENTAEAERRARGAEARLRDAEDAAAAARQEADASRDRAQQRLQQAETSAHNVREDSEGALQAAKQCAEDAMRRVREAEAAREEAIAQCNSLRERAVTAEAAQNLAQQATADAEDSTKAAAAERCELQKRVEVAEAAQKAAEGDASAARATARAAEEQLQSAVSARHHAEGAAEVEEEKAASAQRSATEAEERARAAEAAESVLRRELADAHARVAEADAAVGDAESGAVAACAPAATAEASTGNACAIAPCAECAEVKASLKEKDAEVRQLRQQQESKADVEVARSGEALRLREQLATAECDALALRAEVRKAQEQASSAEKNARDSADAAAKVRRPDVPFQVFSPARSKKPFHLGRCIVTGVTTYSGV